MSARKDEAVGVGGTGASNWSEPTKSSSMGYKDHIPDDIVIQEAAEDYVPPEDYAPPDVGGIEHALPAEERRASEMEYDPVMALIAGDVGTEAPIRSRGRPKGSKEKPGQRALRKNPERAIAPASPEEIERIEAEYARGLESLGGLDYSEEDPHEIARKNDQVAYSLDDVSWREAEALEKKMVNIGREQRALAKRLQAADPKMQTYELMGKVSRMIPGLSQQEIERLNKFWAQEEEARRSGRPSLRTSSKPSVRRGEDPSLRSMVSDPEPRAEDDIPEGSSRYVYKTNDDFKRLRPEAYASLEQMLGYAPEQEDGRFIVLNNKAPRPAAPPTLVRSDPSYDRKKAWGYYANTLLHGLARHASPEGSIFWVESRDWDTDEIDDGEDMMYDSDSGNWRLASALPARKLPEPEKKPDASKAKEKRDWWNVEMTPGGERFYVPDDERRFEREPEGTAVPLPAGLENVDPETLDDYSIPDDEEESTGEQPHRSGLTPWEFRMLTTKGPGFFRNRPSMDRYDDEGMLKPGLRPTGRVSEDIEMDLREFFLREVAHGENAAAKGRKDREPDLRPDTDPDGQLGFQGGEAEEMTSFEPPGFEDPTSSQDPEHGGFGDELPGAGGGPIEAPEGVFQGEEGFGEIGEPFDDDPAGVDDVGPSFSAGSPDDPEIAGSMADPGFGAEENEWAREPQTGEPSPQHRSRVDFPEYEFQKYGGQRGKQRSPEAKKRMPRGWGFDE